jgi:hypothetical protein
MRKQCHICKRKISQLDEITNLCRCGYNFCLKHRIDHECEYDYIKDYVDIIKVEAEKLERI